MSKTLGIIAIKGGVGKTTISSSLAADLVNSYNKKVLLIDTNFTAPNLGLHMDILEPEKTIHHVLDNKIRIQSAIQNKFGVDIIPGSYIYNKSLNYLKLKDKINSIKRRYDFVILDSSPNLNDEALSTILASNILFVVTTPDYPTLSCSLKAAKLAKQRGKPPGFIPKPSTIEAKVLFDSDMLHNLSFFGIAKSLMLSFRAKDRFFDAIRNSSTWVLTEPSVFLTKTGKNLSVPQYRACKQFFDYFLV